MYILVFRKIYELIVLTNVILVYSSSNITEFYKIHSRYLKKQQLFLKNGCSHVIIIIIGSLLSNDGPRHQNLGHLN